MTSRNLCLILLILMCFSNSKAQQIQLVQNLSAEIGDNYQVMESVELNSTLYFSTWGDNGTTLWATDAQNAWPVYNWPFKSDYALNRLSIPSNKLIFTGIDSAHGRELWISDETATVTRMLNDINPGASDAFPSISALDPYNEGDQRYTSFVSLGGKLYFIAYEAVNGSKTGLYETDGTAAGTRKLDFFPQPNPFWNFSPAMATLNGKLFVSYANNLSDLGLLVTRKVFARHFTK